MTGTAPNLVYTPAVDYNGTDSFAFRANDGFSNSNIATISLQIAAVNDAPTATDDSAKTKKNTSVLIDVLKNDRDVDADPIIITSVSTPSRGTVTIVSSGTMIQFTPARNSSGNANFTYSISDNRGGTATANVNVTVSPK